MYWSGSKSAGWTGDFICTPFLTKLPVFIPGVRYSISAYVKSSVRANFYIYITGAYALLGGKIWLVDKAIDSPSAPSLTVISGNLPANTYRVVVTAVNDNGETTASDYAEITLSSTGGIRVSWTAVDGAKGYNVYCGRSGYGAEFNNPKGHAIKQNTDLITTTTFDITTFNVGTFPPQFNTAKWKRITAYAWANFPIRGDQQGLYIYPPDAYTGTFWVAGAKVEIGRETSGFPTPLYDHILPTSGNVYNIGSSSYRFKDLYLAKTSGSILFSDGSKITEDNANLFWDNVNKRLGIGTKSPTEKLHVIGNVRIDDAYKLVWSDVSLYRAAADVLKTPDSFDALALRIGGTEIVDSARNLKNVSADAGIITSGTFDVARIPNLDASKITSGIFPLARLPTSSTANRFLVVRTANADPVYDALVAGDIPSLDASKITSGTFDVARIPNLDASKITSGTFDPARIPSLDASKITSGRFPLARLTDGLSGYFLKGQGVGVDPVYALLTASDIPSLDASKITTGTFDAALIPSLDASKITTGTFDAARIPNLDASKITSGRFALARLPTSSTANRFLAVRTANADPVYDALGSGDIPSLDASKITSGTFDSARIPNLDASKITSGTFDPARIPSLDASKITSGRFSLSRLPTSSTANYALLVRTANADPVYDQVDWNTDIKNKPSSFTPSAHASTHSHGGSDPVTNLSSLAIRGITVIDTVNALQGISGVKQHFLPQTDNTYNLGSSSYRWAEIHAARGYFNEVSSPYGFINDGRFVFVTPRHGDNTGALGTFNNRWNAFYAVNKSASFKHPLHNPDRYIVFKCTEAPKVTIEDWGVAELKGGEASVSLSEEFVALMSDTAEYAVFLTPEGECNGLYVAEKGFDGFKVKELNGGKSNIRFSWQVRAIRIGDEETPVLEEPMPSFTEEEKDKQDKWVRQRNEAIRKKEDNRLSRMRQKIAQYRAARSK